MAAGATWLGVRVLRAEIRRRADDARPCDAAPRADRLRPARQPRALLPRVQRAEGRPALPGLFAGTPGARREPAAIRRASESDAPAARARDCGPRSIRTRGATRGSRLPVCRLSLPPRPTAS